jgi:hypothetical protein
VTNLNVYTVGSEGRQCLRLGTVGSGHDQTARMEHLCDATHPAAADTNEMNATKFVWKINAMVGCDHCSTLSP